ncbi:MAG: DUF6624 domain-containing protein [Rhodanobacter sp.]
MTSLVAAVHADDGDDAMLMQRCPSFAAWKNAHPELSDKNRAKKIAVAKPTDPVLRQQLLEMARADQAARDAWIKADLKTAGGTDPAVKQLTRVDAANLKKLKPLIERQGFPSPARVGIDGVNAAFILVQHADRDPLFQMRVLPQLEASYQHGLISGQDLAMLTDRTLRAQGKPQRYGTQFISYDNRPQMKLQPTEDFAHVDARRARLGMPKLADYACVLSMYYNKPVVATP